MNFEHCNNRNESLQIGTSGEGLRNQMEEGEVFGWCCKTSFVLGASF
jgi:hypothetical protein